MSEQTELAARTARDVTHFWEEINDRRFPLQRCTRCQRHQYYPRVLCRYCHGTSLEWVIHSGRGVVASITQVERAATSAFADAVPYLIALVELDDTAGVKILTNVRSPENRDTHPMVTIGERVVVRRRTRNGCLLHEFVVEENA